MARFLKINELCSDKALGTMKNMDMSSLPPCKKTLEQHLKRVIHTVGTWKQSHLPNPDIPDPVNHGWILVNNVLQPHWFDDEEIPLNLADVEITDESDSDENEFSSDAESEIMSDSDNPCQINKVN